MNPITTYLKSNGNKDLIGVEIGVSKGINARDMLKNLDIKKLYLVDDYRPFIDKKEITCFYINDYKFAEKKLRAYKDKIQFYQDSYLNVKDLIPDELDFVYYDATGEPNKVYSFLNDWFPKIRIGGIISGRRFNSEYYENCKAVIRFIDENNLSFNGKDNYWWLIKDKVKGK